MVQAKKKNRAVRRLTFILIYAVLVTFMYSASTPEIVGALTEDHEKGFHVAAVRLKKGDNESEFIGYSLHYLKSGKVDPASISLLLPDENIQMSQGDLHAVTVLERHPDWQLVEYRYGNTYDSVSRYRAYKDRIEPVSYRITMHPGIFIWALLLLIPAWLTGLLANFLWNAVVRRNGSSMSDPGHR